MLEVLDKVCTPTRGTKYSAGVDLRSREDVTIAAGETKSIPLGVKLDFDTFVKNHAPLFEMNFWEACERGDDGTHYGICGEKVNEFLDSHYLQLTLRSSLAKKGLSIPNGVGMIDIDFTNHEIELLVHNPISKDEVLNYIWASNPAIAEDAQIDTSIKIKRGDRVCQITLLEHRNYLLGMDSDVVRTGGFGSTGKN
jgi:dUTPase